MDEVRLAAYVDHITERPLPDGVTGVIYLRGDFTDREVQIANQELKRRGQPKTVVRWASLDFTFQGKPVEFS
jgi:hypothetical protein